MKRAYTFLLIVISCFAISITTYAQEKGVQIYGYFPSLKDTVAEYSYILLGSSDGNIIYSKEKKLKDNSFEIFLNISSPRLLVLLINGKSLLYGNDSPNTSMLIFPGDSIHLQIDYYGMHNIISSGIGSNRFNYEKEYYLRQNSLPITDLSTGIFDKANHNATIAEQVMDQYKNFLSLQEQRILLAKKYSEIHKLTLYHILRKGITEQDVSYIRKNTIENKAFQFLLNLDSEEYQIAGNLTLMIEYAYVMQSLSDKKTYNKGKSVFADYLTVDKHLQNYNVHKPVLANLILRRATMINLDEELEECYQHFFIHFMEDTPIFKTVENSYNLLKRDLSKGAQVQNFSLTDSLGNTVRLYDYLGKVVVLDFWFHGCGGCAQITPALSEIEQLYKQNSDIVFLSVNVDKKRTMWLSGIGKFAPKDAIHLNTNGGGKDCEMIKYFNIRVYPTLMILDKEGRIYLGRASRPHRVNKEEEAKANLIQEINEVLSL